MLIFRKFVLFSNRFNMKNILFILIITCQFCSAQQIKIDSIANLISFEEINEIDLNKSSIKKEVEKWLALTFVDSKEVIRLSNEDNVIGKGIFKDNIKSGKYLIPMTYEFTVDIAFKEGRYKIEYKDFQQSNSVVPQAIPIFYKPNLNKENYIEFMIQSLEQLGNKELLAMSIKRFEKGKVKDSEIENSISVLEQTKAILEKNISSLSGSLKSQLAKAKKENDW
jgi:hypothetical protein